MPSHPAKKANFEQEAHQELRYWTTSLKTQLLQPIKYYSHRQPKLDNRRTLIRSLCWALIPFLIFALAEAFLDKRYLLIPLYALGPFAGIALWSYLQQLLLDKLFDKKFTFQQTFDLALTVAPAFVIAWIPTAGLVAFFVVACVWNYFGIVYQFKLDKGLAMMAATLPIVVSGAATIALGYLGVMLLYFGGGK